MGARKRKAQRALLGRLLGDADYTETLWTGEDAGRSDFRAKLREVAYPSPFAAAARIVATFSRKAKNLRTKNPCSYAVPLARR